MSALRPQAATVAAIILAAAFARLVPHVPNVTPVAAMALFGGAYLKDWRLALFMPLAAMFASDAVIGFHPGMFPVYSAFLMTVGLGMLLRRRATPLNVAAASFSGSAIFFLVTNIPAGGQLYPFTPQGFMESYTAALPFFRNTVLGDLFYNALFFGGYAALKSRLPALQRA